MMNRDAFRYPPRGMPLEEASRYIGVDATDYTAMVADGRMPQPKTICGRLIWDRFALDLAFSSLRSKESALTQKAERTKTATAAQVFTPSTFAKEWGCSEAHIRKLIASGELPAFKLGGKLLRIKREAEESYFSPSRLAVPEPQTLPKEVESPPSTKIRRKAVPRLDRR